MRLVEFAVQGGDVTCLSHSSVRQQTWGLNSGNRSPESIPLCHPASPTVFMWSRSFSLFPSDLESPPPNPGSSTFPRGLQLTYCLSSFFCAPVTYVTSYQCYLLSTDQGPWVRHHLKVLHASFYLFSHVTCIILIIYYFTYPCNTL